MKRILSIGLILLLMLTEISGSASACTTTTSGSYTISPSAAAFKNAKSPMYCLKSQTISGKISSAKQLDIYHYEAQSGGWYAVYTTGSLDTVGKVYEENGVFSVSYDQVAYSDDAYLQKAYSNCGMVVNMDKWEDYYLCVRGYGSKTGSYTLKIEPNEDKNSYRNYGVWECEHMPDSAAISGCWYTRKVYLTRQQAILYYWMLDPATDIVSGTKSYNLEQLNRLYKTNESTAVNAG